MIAACSIPVSILGAMVVVRTPSIVGVASMVMGKSSQVVPSLSILPLAALNLLLLPFNHKGLVYQLLVVVRMLPPSTACSTHHLSLP